MTPIEIKDTSWHYWFANQVSYTSNAKSSCDYIWMVVKGFLAMLLMVAVVGLCLGATSFIIGDTIAWGVCLFTHGVVFPDAGAFLGTFFTVVGILYLMIRLIEEGFKLLWCYISNIEITHTPPKPDGAVTLLFRSFKDKICVPIKVVKG